jgi:hypothetical protein
LREGLQRHPFAKRSEAKDKAESLTAAENVNNEVLLQSAGTPKNKKSNFSFRLTSEIDFSSYICTLIINC